MIKRRGQSFAAWLCVCDMVAVGVAWVGAYHFRFSGWIPVTKEQPPPEWCYDDIPLIVTLGVLAFWLARNYEISRLRRLREELWAVSKAIPLLVLMATGAAFFQQDPYVSRGAILLFAGLAFFTVMLGRRLS